MADPLDPELDVLETSSEDEDPSIGDVPDLVQNNFAHELDEIVRLVQNECGQMMGATDASIQCNTTLIELLRKCESNPSMFDSINLDQEETNMEEPEDLAAENVGVTPPWGEIHADVLMHIFSFLKDKDFSSAAQVCHHWNEVATSNTIIRYATFTCDRAINIRSIFNTIRKMPKLKCLRLIFPNGPVRFNAALKTVLEKLSVPCLQFVGTARWMITSKNGNLITPLRRIAIQDLQAVVLRPVTTPAIDYLLKVKECFPNSEMLPPKYRHVFDVDTITSFAGYLGPSTSVIINDWAFQDDQITEADIAKIIDIYKDRVTDIVLNSVEITGGTLSLMLSCTQLERIEIRRTNSVWPSQIRNLGHLERVHTIRLGTFSFLSSMLWYWGLLHARWHKKLIKRHYLLLEDEEQNNCGIMVDVELARTRRRRRNNHLLSN